jgi:hypothetical protein
MKSFFGRLLSGIESMWKKAPAIEVAIASGVNNLVPLVEKLDTIILGPEALVLNPILDKVKVGLTALKTVNLESGLATGTANLTSITSSVQGHLTELETVAGIKNPALAEKIKEVTSIVSAEVAGIHAGVTAAVPAAAAPAAAPAAEAPLAPVAPAEATAA